MTSIYRDLLIGIIGSVIGALIVYFSSYGLNLTKAASLKHAKKMEREKALWRTRKIQVRMEITNNYLFEILKAFLLGSTFNVVTTLMIYSIFSRYPVLATLSLIYSLASVSTVIGLFYYFIALGKVIRYLRIRRADKDYLNTYLDEESTESGPTPPN